VELTHAFVILQTLCNVAGIRSPLSEELWRQIELMHGQTLEENYIAFVTGPKIGPITHK
jgi:hypothetical protein